MAYTGLKNTTVRLIASECGRWSVLILSVKGPVCNSLRCTCKTGQNIFTSGAGQESNAAVTQTGQNIFTSGAGQESNAAVTQKQC